MGDDSHIRHSGSIGSTSSTKSAHKGNLKSRIKRATIGFVSGIEIEEHIKQKLQNLLYPHTAHDGLIAKPSSSFQENVFLERQEGASCVNHL